jgi:hypothetical protein
MALTAIVDAVVKVLVTLFVYPFAMVAPLLHPRLIHFVQYVTSALWTCKTGKAAASADVPTATTAPGPRPVESAEQQWAEMRKLPRDGTEEMSRGELLHRLRTNIGTLHDLLRGKSQEGLHAQLSTNLWYLKFVFCICTV